MARCCCSRRGHLYAVLEVAEDGVNEPDHRRQPRPAGQQACSQHVPFRICCICHEEVNVAGNDVKSAGIPQEPRPRP